MSDQLRVCPECGDLLPMPCSDPAACIMTDDLSDHRAGGQYTEISEHLDWLNKRIEKLETDHAAYVAKHSYHNEIVRGYQQRIANLEARADLADKWEVTDSE